MLFPLPELPFLPPSLLPLAGSHSPFDSQLGHHFYFVFFIISSKKPFLDPKEFRNHRTHSHGPGLAWHHCVIHSFNINLLSAYSMSGTVSGLGTATNQTEPSTLGRCTIYKLFDVFRLLTISPTRQKSCVICSPLDSQCLVWTWQKTGFITHLLKSKPQEHCCLPWESDAGAGAPSPTKLVRISW